MEIVLDDDEEEIPGTLDEVVSLMDDAEETVPEDAPSPVKDEGKILKKKNTGIVTDCLLF